MSKPRRPALGRGLGALIPTDRPPAQRPSAPRPDDAEAPEGVRLRRLTVDQLEPNPAQPRRHFDPQALAELSASIKAQGIIQPIVVAPAVRGRYPILAGERRWRAAQQAGVLQVPVVVRDTPEEQRFELALVENLQRSDLNPIEEAMAYQQLADLRGYTQEQIAQRVGKDRSTIANAIRLLRLPEKVQGMVVDGALSMGHARALLALPSPAAMTELAGEIVRRKLSVRATEAEVRRLARPEAPPTPPSEDAKRHEVIVRDLEDRLRRNLGVRAKLKTGKDPRGAGRIELPYGDLDELQRLLQILLDEPGGPRSS